MDWSDTGKEGIAAIIGAGVGGITTALGLKPKIDRLEEKFIEAGDAIKNMKENVIWRDACEKCSEGNTGLLKMIIDGQKEMRQDIQTLLTRRRADRGE